MTPNDGPQDTTGMCESDEVDISGNETVMEPSVPGPSTAQTRTPGGAENTNKQQPTPTKRTSQRPLRPKEFKKQILQILQKMVMFRGKKS